jgi:hypothetical protein
MFSVLDETDDDVDTERVVLNDTIPVVTETVTVRPVRRVEQGKTYVGVDPANWDADALLSYVATQIQRLHGPFPRDPKKETAIMRSFLNRWGDRAGAIAQYAFEVSGGMWRGSPVGITRFCKASDAYFGQVILDRLN